MKLLLVSLCALVFLGTDALAFDTPRTVPDTSLAKRKTVFRSGVVTYALHGFTMPDTLPESKQGVVLSFDEYGTKASYDLRFMGFNVMVLMNDSVEYEYLSKPMLEGIADSSVLASMTEQERQSYKEAFEPTCRSKRRDLSEPSEFKSLFVDDILSYLKQSNLGSTKITVTRIQDSILLGKRCMGYEVKMQQGRKKKSMTVMKLHCWFWEQVPMCLKMVPMFKGSGSDEGLYRMELVATSIDVNQPIPAATFLPPPGMKIVDRDNPERSNK